MKLTKGSFSGNISAKRRKGAGFSPKSYTESMIVASKTGGRMESPHSDSMKFSARPPNHSGKIKLQLFPIDETIQKIMQQVSPLGSVRAPYKHYIQSSCLKVFSPLFA